MSFVTNVQNFATRVATEVKALRTLINGNAADLTGLNTTVKTNLVAAINEVNSKPSGTGGASINDAATSTTTVWSSTKTDTEIGSRVSAVVNAAPTTLDTLDELANALGDDPNFATTTATALGNRVRFDAAQTLTAPQQTQARSNIGAGTSNLAIGTTSTTAKAGDYQPTAANISDSTATGRSVITAATAAAARTAIGAGTSDLALGTTGTTAAAGNHTHTATGISDSTTVGRSVITAVDAAAARTAIGAGTSNLAIGTTGTTAAAGNDSRLSDARTPLAHAASHASGGTDPVTPAAIGAAAASHTHTAANISDSTTVGRAVLTAVDSAAARAATGAGTSNLVIGTTAGTAADAAAVGDTTTDFVATFVAGLV